jgi:hypothetical protein
MCGIAGSASFERRRLSIGNLSLLGPNPMQCGAGRVWICQRIIVSHPAGNKSILETLRCRIS